MERRNTMPRLEAVADLTQLSSAQDDLIVSCLRERFLQDTIYTNLGSYALVAVNPHKYVGSNADAVLMQYCGEYRDTAEEKTYKPPHVFQLASNAYYHMRRTGQDQSVMILGETGSGKSESRRLAIKLILELSVSNPGKKGSKLSAQIPSAEFVLETFGCARTLYNPNASRFGKYTELQFNEKGRICGVKTLDYYFERSRVAGAPSGERNFHIFYYLVAGASVEERQHLRLDDKTPYRYLGQRGGRSGMPDPEDANRFEQLKHALKMVGFSKRHVAQTCQLVAAILHLGNLDFMIDRKRNEDAAVVRNTEVLDLVAEFLGVAPGQLESTLSYRTKLVKKELCTVFLDPEGASDNRDDLAKSLYSLLFAWLNEHINQRLCREDFTTFIGLVDLPGPQNLSGSRSNSLDQLMVNFANERLLHFVQTKMFESHVEEYTTEGISKYVPSVQYYDNRETIKLFCNRPGGLIHIMDDQARRAPKKNAHTMVEAMTKRWANNNNYESPGVDRSGFPTFKINHFNGSVTYSSEDFLERDTDALNPDFVSLLRGSADFDEDKPTIAHPAAGEAPGSNNPFVRGLFSAKAIATQAHPRHEETIVAAQQSVKPMRQPSTRRKQSVRKRQLTGGGIEPTIKEDDEAQEEAPSGIHCVAGEFNQALETLFQTLEDTQSWFIFCINPNDAQLPNQLEGRMVRAQVRSLGLPEMTKRSGVVFTVSMEPGEFVDRYKDQLTLLGVGEGSEKEKIEQAKTALGLSETDIVQGAFKVFLSQLAFHKFEDHLRANDVEEQKRNRLRDAEIEAGLEPRTFDPYAPYGSGNFDSPSAVMVGYQDSYGQSSPQLPLVANAQPFNRGGGGASMFDDDYDDRKSFRTDDYEGSRYDQRDEVASNLGSESYAPSRNMFQASDVKKPLVGEKEALPGEVMEGEVAEELKDTPARRRWVALCWLLTFWCPTPLLTYVGRMKRMDIRQAWREKLAINIIIWFTCLCAIFVIVVLNMIICPRQYVYNMEELASHSPTGQFSNRLFTYVRGEVFDLTQISDYHFSRVPVVQKKAMQAYAGVDASDLFPVQVSAVCNGPTGTLSPYVALNTKNVTDVNAKYHDFTISTSDYRPDWYIESMIYMRYKYRVGFVGYAPDAVKKMYTSQGRIVAVYNDLVYDLTDYANHGANIVAPYGYSPVAGVDTTIIDPRIVQLFRDNSGTDITKKFDSFPFDEEVLARTRTCLRNLFVIGKADHRNAPQCLFGTNILLAISIMMITIIGFKFLAALQFGAARAPEDHDKFVICQVPCYTEDEDSLRRTIDSLAVLKYDDKRKLLFIICDGMIVGSGNDRPTPRIVLDILGADPNLDPEPMSFLSLGEGAKQHNMGKIYSGLYECAGHVVPYVVLVKVGKPTERSRPGNRGKRDSQMALMRFLNKVHFNAAMNPLELEMYHQIKNVIGVNPTFYEYVFMIDADTTVDPLSLNRLVSAMMHDRKVIGVCGETSLANSKQSIITMMQVYEYFISHHMAKAFESLFGSVTCLPGCFTMYRLRTHDTHKPLFVSNQIIEDYSENRVDTLHMKNLLHLGEDRYLTTLLLKHFPNYKTQFIRDAHAYTVAPDEWKVLLSQRRRWINSTIHNLAELVFLERLCGFCCFSMRFIVFIDLLSTIIQPVTVAYLGYLVYLVAADGQTIPTLSLVMIACVYGLQALIFILRRKWDMVGWMIFYILAIPAFSFWLPLYSFWRMDDFSWGQTRLVLGEKGKKLIVHDEGKFDPRSIPLKSWNDYENELWDKESNHSIGSWIPPQKFKDDDGATASLYGRETMYDPPASRAYSPAPSQFGMNAAYHNSGRNTPAGAARQSSYNMDPGYNATAGSRMSGNLLAQPSRANSQYLPEFSATGPLIGGEGGGPTDFELELATQKILGMADLNSITKREVRRQLEQQYGIDLTSRKAVINAAIDRHLNGA
ncbi:glycosyltransferase family 2 protein [Tulasnella calospora MUT 4182]|uniref:chitin synthase n=1 Tax=Tulasnella calospora MUT 4182 TaxID=1051891 RepID=A0A0C3QPE0_9AGAM|nr:glycosyltransferase family 2 protein [Tulasnella calospora MUT 4182]